MEPNTRWQCLNCKKSQCFYSISKQYICPYSCGSIACHNCKSKHHYNNGVLYIGHNKNCKKQIQPIKCPYCKTEYDEEKQFIVCDNDCNSNTCHKCDCEFYFDFKQNKLIAGHSIYCGVYTSSDDESDSSTENDSYDSDDSRKNNNKLN